jgi:hypothetical protein
MTFDEVLDQVRELLQRRGRVTYRSLKLRYQLDDELLAGVTDELIKAERVAADEDGEVLVWTGASPVSSSEFQVPSSRFHVPPSLPLRRLRTPDFGRRTLTPRPSQNRSIALTAIVLATSARLS